jgi:hypothetical protein
MKKLKFLLAAGVVLLITACGGGGGNASAPTDAALVKDVGSVNYSLDKSVIDNSGTDKALLTVTVLDSSRNALAGVPVSVALSSGAFTPVATTTDSSGQISGAVSIGGDASSRNIVATIVAKGTSGSVSSVATVVVAANKVELAFSNAQVTVGQPVTITVSTKNSIGLAIPNVPVLVTGSAGVAGNYTTDISGTKAITFNASSTVGSYDVTAQALGLTPVTATLKVVAPSNVIPAPVASTVQINGKNITPNPSSISPNLTGASSSSTITAKFIDSNNLGITGIRARFYIVEPGLDTAEHIDQSGQATLYTDTTGGVSALYVPGPRTSPTNGVTVGVCYKYTDFNDAVDFRVSTISGQPQCVPSATVFVLTTNLTVASQSLSISIGDNNLLEAVNNSLGYSKKFLIQVNDAAGVALEGAVVSLSVDITHYGKGIYGNFYPSFTPPTIFNGSIAVISSGPLITIEDAAGLYGAPLGSAAATAPINGYNNWCANEDINRNGFLDAGEDRDGNTILEPRKADIIVSYLNGNKTDNKGQLVAQVTYPQNVATWLAYTLRATTAVGGSEGDARRSFFTQALDADTKDGSFRTPPYGSESCNSPK